MDRPGVRQVPEGGGEQRKIEETGREIICGAPTTLAVKGLMMMMMMMTLNISLTATLYTPLCLCVCLCDVQFGRYVVSSIKIVKLSNSVLTKLTNMPKQFSTPNNYEISKLATPKSGANNYVRALLVEE